MAKSKLTLIVDGNWLLMSRLAVLNQRYQDDNELNKNLKLMMIRSINVVLRTFTDIDNIIFVADGGSWRNEVVIPESLVQKQESGDIESEEYKGTRKKSEDFNWDLLFANYEEFISDLQTSGITACREKGMEGDDWCYHWSRLLNENNTNVIIWSADKDLTQLVSMNKDKCFTVWWNSKAGIICSTEPSDDMNWLFNQAYDTNESIYRNICDAAGSVKQINPRDVVLSKIIHGDASDNVQPIMLRNAKSKDSTKKYKISSKDIDFEMDYNNDEVITKYITELYNSKNYIGRVNDSVEDVINHFKYNRTLVQLSDKEYPEYIKEILVNYSKYPEHISKDITIAESKITAKSNDLHSILELI